MKDVYVKTMQSFLTDGYARPLRNDEIQEDKSHGIWYVPHHGVINPKKPGKVRVVFDCASKFKGKSINDHMYTGPDVLNTLLGVLLRFRQERVAIVGDVEAMYHRVRVYEEDERFLRFLWWKDGNLNEKASQFCMTVNIFGAAPSGFIANTALRRCADDGIGTCHPDVVKSVHENFYVDDYLMSVPDESTAISHVREIRSLLSKGGFRLHKWMSTSKRVLETIEPTERAGAVKEINEDTDLPRERALGVHWNVQTDAFIFNIDLKEKATSVPVTRRTILSIAASLFDPIGFLAPITLIPKLIMQELCRSKLEWDDHAPEDLVKRWEDWLQEMPLLTNTQITRCLKPEILDREMTTELHFFADASEVAYGAVCYLKVRYANHFRVSFIIGKSRLAPIKLVTIPRLELCAAVLAARLSELVKKELRLPVSDTYFWTDSYVYDLAHYQ